MEDKSKWEIKGSRSNSSLHSLTCKFHYDNVMNNYLRGQRDSWGHCICAAAAKRIKWSLVPLNKQSSIEEVKKRKDVNVLFLKSGPGRWLADSLANRTQFDALKTSLELKMAELFLELYCWCIFPNIDIGWWFLRIFPNLFWYRTDIVGMNPSLTQSVRYRLNHEIST